MSRVVIVGASLAGLRAADALRRIGHDGSIVVVGAESHPPYDRPPLSKQVLTGKADADGIGLEPHEDLHAEWLLGTKVTALDVATREVTLSGGERLGYDGLVIATGATPRILRGFEPSADVHYLRTLEDSLRMRDQLSRVDRIGIVGAGFIGLEVAASAAQLGIGVTVLEALPLPLVPAVGEQMGAAIAEFHRRHGIDIRLDVRVEGLVGDESLEGVRLAGDEIVPAQMVVVGVGVTPETGWLDGSGVDVKDGVLCDSRLRVLSGGKVVPDVVAAGDVARWEHPGWGGPARIEHWTNAVDQGEAAARTLLEGDSAPEFVPTPYFWSDQHGVKIQFVGRAQPGDDIVMLEGSPTDERFVAAYGRKGRLVAALGMRRPARIMALQHMIAEGTAFPPPA